MNNASVGELWRYRELLYFFAWRDVKVRYRQAVMGAGWAVLQPLLAGVANSFELAIGGLTQVANEVRSPVTAAHDADFDCVFHST